MSFETTAAEGRQEQKNTKELFQEIAKREKGFIEKFQGKAHEVAKVMTLISGLSLGTACETPQERWFNEEITVGETISGIPGGTPSPEASTLIQDLHSLSQEDKWPTDEHYLDQTHHLNYFRTIVYLAEVLYENPDKQSGPQSVPPEMQFTAEYLTEIKSKIMGGAVDMPADMSASISPDEAERRAREYEKFYNEISQELEVKIFSYPPEVLRDAMMEAERALVDFVDKSEEGDKDGVLNSEEEEMWRRIRYHEMTAFDWIENRIAEELDK